MDESGQSDYKHKVVNILRVTRAVPPGSNVIRYELFMEIGQSNCLQTIQIKRQDCQLQSNIPINFCHVVIDERPLMEENNRQIVYNNCTMSLDKINEVNGNIESTLIPETLATSKNNNENESFDDVKSELYDQLAVEGQFITNKSPIDDSLIKVSVVEIITEEPLKVINLSTDLENKNNKFMDKIKEFDEFLENFDVPIKQRVENDDHLGQQEVSEELIRPVMREKRTLSEEESFIRALSQKAMESLDEQDEDDNKRKIIEVLESRKIENGGALYQVTLRVALMTNCKEKSSEENKNCTQELGQLMNICKIQIKVPDKMKLENAQVVPSPCKPEKSMKKRRRRRQLLGGQKIIPVDDITVKEFVTKGLKEYSALPEVTSKTELIEVLNASKQIVSGTKYTIGVKLGETDCAKASPVAQKCQLKSDKNKICVISAWSQPWLNKEVVSVRCENDSASSPSKKRKRSLRGVNYSSKMLTMGKQIELERKFNKFQEKYNKTYLTEQERQVRLLIFEENMKMVEELQASEQGTAVYGASIFADMTPNEFKRTHLGYRAELRSQNDIPLVQANIPNDIELPNEFDWRQHNAVTPVKNQGSCGSCWAFSVTGNVEGQYAIKHGKLLSFSEQELVDCDKLDEGCNGGLQENAYRALENIGGLELEQDYPYDGEDETCHFKKGMARVEIASAVNITSNETQMAQWLVKNGPMAIAINANAMQFYMGGISHPFKFLCNKNNLDHGVLIVGYGIHNYPIFKKSLPFWIVKNSWGKRWGEQGYYRVYRGDGTCGLNTDVSSAIVK